MKENRYTAEIDEYSKMSLEGQGMTDDTWRIKQFACFVSSL